MAVTTEARVQLSERPVDVDIVAKHFRGLGDPTRVALLEDNAGHVAAGRRIDAGSAR